MDVKRFISILHIFFIINFSQVFAFDSNDNLGKDVRMNKLEEYYICWHKEIDLPKIVISSRTEPYINTVCFKNIVNEGKEAIPFLVYKIKESRSLGWKNGDYFLWHALRKITGINLSQNLLSEQEIAEKYLERFENYY